MVHSGAEVRHQDQWHARFLPEPTVGKAYPPALHELSRSRVVRVRPWVSAPQGRVNMELPLAVLSAGTSSCSTSQCSASLPFATRKISTATIGFGPQPT